MTYSQINLTKVRGFLFLTALILLAGCIDAEKIRENFNRNEVKECLLKQNLTFYGTENCPHCKNQKEILGDLIRYVTYVDCEKEIDKCKEAKIQSVPTWIINGEKSMGELSLDQLCKEGEVFDNHCDTELNQCIISDKII